jgi:integrase
MEFGPPKSDAGVRTVALPAVAVSALRTHLATYVGDGPDALIFTGKKGAVLRTGNFQRAVKWSDATRAAWLGEGFHFHDLSHTGNTVAATAGASTRELMDRLGQSSVRAALVYQHAASERDREIADGIDRRIGEQSKRKRRGKRAR